jgi:hypothetical protein
VSVAGIGVAVAGIGVSVGGIGVSVGGTGVSVAGIGVSVGASVGVAVGGLGFGVAVGGSGVGVEVGGSGVGVSVGGAGVGVGVAVARGGTLPPAGPSPPFEGGVGVGLQPREATLPIHGFCAAAPAPDPPVGSAGFPFGLPTA